MKTKRIIAFACALAMVGTGIYGGYVTDNSDAYVSKVYAETLTYENYEYELNKDGEITITGYWGEDTEIVIPSEIDGRKVTSIGDRAFYQCRSLTSITLPEGVTSIGDSAFDYCSSLTSITLPEGVTSIGFGAFSECSSLTSITLPEGVTSIGEYAFSSCTGLESVIIPEGVKSIGVVRSITAAV